MNLDEYFDITKGRSVLATANAEGLLDTAVYARPKVLNEGTVAFKVDKVLRRIGAWVV